MVRRGCFFAYWYFMAGNYLVMAGRVLLGYLVRRRVLLYSCWEVVEGREEGTLVEE